MQGMFLMRPAVPCFHDLKIEIVQGNPDGQSKTNFGALAAYEVPWIVIPDQFASAYPKEFPGNNVAAVIW